MRVCGRFVSYVIKLIEKKRERGLLIFLRACGTAYAESLVFPFTLKKHANILTLPLFPLKSMTYAF